MGNILKVSIARSSQSTPPNSQTLKKGAPSKGRHCNFAEPASYKLAHQYVERCPKERLRWAVLLAGDTTHTQLGSLPSAEDRFGEQPTVQLIS